jgi:dolichol-phosphate mannosyltransferase
MGMSSSLILESKIEVVIAIPAYNEIASLPLLIKGLNEYLSETDAVLVLDDSPDETYNQIKIKVEDAFKESRGLLVFSHSSEKLGRGSAIRRGMDLSTKRFSNLKYFIECDADGSHQIEDIVNLKNFKSDCHLLIGSRYLKNSKIVGWPILRRIFSKILNMVIPFILNVPVKDITNGLRRYTPGAINQILSYKPINMGFIYLSEQALIIYSSRLKLGEIPITFVERVAGSSTVTWKEVSASIKGVFYLSLLKRKIKASG